MTLIGMDSIITLSTYGDDIFAIEFSVSKSWLSKKVDMPIDEFLLEYTFDDSEQILRLAKDENMLLSMAKLN